METNIITKAFIPGTKLDDLGRLAPTSFLDLLALLFVGAGSVAYLFPQWTWNKPDPYHHIWFERPQQQEGGLNNASQTTRNIAQRLEELVRAIFAFIN